MVYPFIEIFDFLIKENPFLVCDEYTFISHEISAS